MNCDNMDSDDGSDLEVWNLAKSYSTVQSVPSNSSGQEVHFEDNLFSDSDIESDSSERDDGPKRELKSPTDKEPLQRLTTSEQGPGVEEIDEADVEMETANSEEEIDETGVENETTMNLQVEYCDPVPIFDNTVDQNLDVEIQATNAVGGEIQVVNSEAEEINVPNVEIQSMNAEEEFDEPEAEIEAGNSEEEIDFSSGNAESLTVKVDSSLQVYKALKNAGAPIIHVPAQLLTGAAFEWKSENEEWDEVWPSVKIAYQTLNGVSYGYMEIGPKTLKPFDTERTSTVIYWVHDGKITLKTNAMEKISNNFGDVALRKFNYERGHIFVIPPNVPNSFENYTDEIARLGFVEIGPDGVSELPVAE